MLRANIGGYFWLPCKICGEYFGGHESYKGEGLYKGDGISEMVCSQECSEKAHKINLGNPSYKEFWGIRGSVK